MQALNQNFLLSTRSAASKGLWPHEYPINKGTILYRFIDQKHAATGAADGPWWFEFEHFQTIRHFALKHGYSLGYAARLFAAILYEWSEVNALVRAQADVSLLSWKGRGKQVIVGQHRPLHDPEIDARDRNRTPKGLVTEHSPVLLSKMTPMQGLNEVYQLYIPGLGPPHHKFCSYFKLLSCEPIATN